MSDPAVSTLRERSRSTPVPTLPSEATGAVLWHRDHLRVRDHPALAAAADADHLLPLFVFDPTFYGAEGRACDARLRFLHECLVDLDEQYRTFADGGLSYAVGDPLAVLERFRAAGWEVVAAAGPTGRYGRERDRRARTDLGVTFADGDGLVRGDEHSRTDWSDRVEEWLDGDRHAWDPSSVRLREFAAGVTPEAIEAAFDVDPEKSRVPRGGTGPARSRLEAFAERLGEYPGRISAPAEAREGTSGLSPYLKFGCLSVREVYQHVVDRAPDGRGTEMFVSRLYWNKHYEQKLEDWSGWTDRAVNPELRGFNADRRDSDLIDAWKRGRTGYPMVDASMRCLRETGWLNFRMRALCASVYFHVLQQPWRVGADWFFRHLIDGEASINYTQWQSQCGLVGRPTLRLYNPRKQVRDQDPDGEFIFEWVPELDDLPTAFLDRPERTPIAVQRDCGVRIGEAYPRPVVEYEAAREEFRERLDAARPAAADALGRDEIADRASLSGGRSAAEAIARRHGSDAEDGDGEGVQSHLDAFGGDGSDGSDGE